MIRKIETSELRIGMFIDNLDCSWLKHPFVKNKFTVKNSQIIQKIASAGIRHVYIDIKQGDDVEELEINDEPEPTPTAKESPDESAKTSVAEESGRARLLFREATTVVRNMMEDARLGKQVEMEALDPIAERMVQIAMRNHHALNCVTRIKNKDEYTFMHSVSVAGLMVSFAQALGLAEEVLHQVAIGGLVHDIGKTLIPDKILNKPDKLETSEMDVMKKHVIYSQQLLKESLGLSQEALDVTVLHHERMDGAGYPLGLGGDQISNIGQMAAIVDVYDALTSERAYKEAWEPTHTLKKLIEWSPAHFNPDLVQQFIRCLGIYPVGSLVELESGLLALVMEPGENMLRPRLKAIYSVKQKSYIKVKEIDLARVKTDSIVKAISPRQYNIKVEAFM